MRERFKLEFHFNDRLRCFQVFFSLSPILQNLNTVAITSKEACVLRKDSSLKGSRTLTRKLHNFQMMLKSNTIYISICISIILFKLTIFAPGTVFKKIPLQFWFKDH